MELTELERTVLSMVLAGDDPTLATLRAQLDAATITSRKYTGVGFFTDFSVPENVERLLQDRVVIDDVHGTSSDGTDVGFVLFTRNGALSCLEGYTYGCDEWRPDLHAELYYMRHEPPDSPILRRCANRDMDQLRGDLRGLSQ